MATQISVNSANGNVVVAVDRAPRGYIGSQGIPGNPGGYTGSKGDTGYIGSQANLLAVSSSIIPDTNVAYDLGSPSHQWRSLYVSTNTIYVDSNAISVNPVGQMTVNEQIVAYADPNPTFNSANVTTDLTTYRLVFSSDGSSVTTANELMGYTGSQGNPGTPGDPGYVGSQGDIGYVGSAGGGGSFDQSLNTTDSVLFKDLSINANIVFLGGFESTLTDAVGHILTPNNGATISSDQFQWGPNSLYCPSGSNVVIDAGSNFEIGLNDYTVECWIYVSSFDTTGNFAVVSLDDTNHIISIHTDDQTIYEIGYWDGTQSLQSSGLALTLNTWNYITISRNNYSIWLGANGQNQFVGQSFVNFNTSNQAYIHNDINNNSAYTSYIQDLRITNGTALNVTWDGMGTGDLITTFIPPSTPLTLNLPIYNLPTNLPYPGNALIIQGSLTNTTTNNNPLVWGYPQGLQSIGRYGTNSTPGGYPQHDTTVQGGNKRRIQLITSPSAINPDGSLISDGRPIWYTQRAYYDSNQYPMSADGFFSIFDPNLYVNDTHGNQWISGQIGLFYDDKKTNPSRLHIGWKLRSHNYTSFSDDPLPIWIGQNQDISLYTNLAFNSHATNPPAFKLRAVQQDAIFTVPVTMGAYTLPITDGSNGQTLTTNGSGSVTWQTGGGGYVGSQGDPGTPGDPGYVGSQGDIGYVGSAGGGGSFDQSLNTTDSVTFSNLTVTNFIVDPNNYIQIGFLTSPNSSANIQYFNNNNTFAGAIGIEMTTTYGDGYTPTYDPVVGLKTLFTAANYSDGADYLKVITGNPWALITDDGTGNGSNPQRLHFGNQLTGIKYQKPDYIPVPDTYPIWVGQDQDISLYTNLPINTTAINPPAFKLRAVEQDAIFTVPVTMGAYTLPITDGSNGQTLTTDGSGSVTWQTSGGYTGSQGDIGYVGSQGDPVGYTGSQGDIGYVGSQGDIGYVGSQGYIGDTGYTGSAGQGFVYQGDWIDITTYNPYDVVTYNGSAWITPTVSLNEIPGVAGSWYLFVNAGAQGDIGYVGSQGDPGYVGSSGSYNQSLNTTDSVTFSNLTVTNVLIINDIKQSGTYFTSISGNSPVTLITFDSNQYTSAKLLVQISDSGNISINELSIVWDGTNGYLVEYDNNSNTNTVLGTFSLSPASSTINLIYTPIGATNMNIRTAITLMAI